MSFTAKLLAGSALLAAVAWGQTDQPDPEDRNHGVARVSLMNGDVSVRRGDSGDYVAASLNAPLLVQDAVQTGQASRAEVQFDYANRLRIADNAEVRMAELVAGSYQIQIARGTATLSVLRESAAQVEIDTPSVAVRPSRNGEYRVAVLEDGTTQITVRSGEARIDSARGEERLQAGQTMLARGSADNPEFQIVAAIGRDDWDVFNERRDHELDHSESARYVSRDIAGAEDLDGYGQWVSDPSYGQVWAPRVAADWAPYRSGRWVWEDYYGWTWVSYDPWGWAPYHYGNWFVGSRGWSWYPGPIYSRHWYRPALVGFFGYGGGAGVGFGFGNIGWVPLAPFERFHPWYGRSGGYGGYGGFGRGVNVVNNVNIANTYRNARAANGVTSMNSRDFGNGQFGRFSSVGANELRSASAFHGTLPVTPGGGSLRFNDRQTGVPQRNSFGQTRFASRNQPVQTARTAFGQQPQRSFAQGGGGQPNSAWQRFGSPSRGATSSAPPVSNYAPSSRQFAQSSSQSSSGWDRFGSPSNRSSQPASPRNFTPPAQQFGSQAGGRPVQVAPPMVRERSTPGFSQQSPSYRSAPSQPSYNQRGYSQPSYNQRSYSQPSSNQQSYRQPSSSQRSYSTPSAPSNRSGSGSSGGNSRSSGSSRSDSGGHHGR